MIVDLELCVNCYNCVLATKDEHAGNDFEGYSAAQSGSGLELIRIEKHLRGVGDQSEMTYVPKMCNHCDDAPCIKADKTGAIRKREDGIVLIDPELSKKAENLPRTCPHGMIIRDEKTNVSHIWNFDAHLLDNGWKEPRCTQACPTGALKAVQCSDDEMDRMAQAENLKTFPTAKSVRSRLHYKNAYRLTTDMISGTVLYLNNGQKDCAETTNVTLLSEDGEIDRVTTDGFGEFFFVSVPKTEMNLQLKIQKHDGGAHIVDVDRDTEQVIEVPM